MTEFWKSHSPDRDEHITEGFVSNLKDLNKLSKIWAHKKISEEEHRVNEIEKEIANLEENSKGTFPSVVLRDKHVELTTLRGKFSRIKRKHGD